MEGVEGGLANDAKYRLIISVYIIFILLRKTFIWIKETQNAKYIQRTGANAINKVKLLRY